MAAVTTRPSDSSLQQQQHCCIDRSRIHSNYLWRDGQGGEQWRIRYPFHVCIPNEWQQVTLQPPTLRPFQSHQQCMMRDRRTELNPRLHGPPCALSRFGSKEDRCLKGLQRPRKLKRCRRNELRYASALIYQFFSVSRVLPKVIQRVLDFVTYELSRFDGLNGSPALGQWRSAVHHKRALYDNVESSHHSKKVLHLNRRCFRLDRRDGPCGGTRA